MQKSVSKYFKKSYTINYVVNNMLNIIGVNIHPFSRLIRRFKIWVAYVLFYTLCAYIKNPLPVVLINIFIYFYFLYYSLRSYVIILIKIIVLQ